jgi:hypothetical protein
VGNRHRIKEWAAAVLPYNLRKGIGRRREARSPDRRYGSPHVGQPGNAGQIDEKRGAGGHDANLLQSGSTLLKAMIRALIIDFVG